MKEHLQKWRLILGKEADPKQSVALGSEGNGMDAVLEALYNSEREGGLGASSPNINRWLGDIRTYFPSSVVQVMQRDALDRLGLERMLLEPELLESLEMDVQLVGTILSLQKIMPQQTRETARKVVRKVVEDLQKRLQNPLQVAIKGALQRALRKRRPKWTEVDWHRTIRANLKNYQPQLDAIIPETLIGYGKKGHALKHIILLVDQSGSMATSIVYASVFGAILASLRSIKTAFIVFDTSVVNLTDQLEDPVDLLFGTQLGGGTDISKALTYAETLIERPNDTILVLLTDLFEGGNVRQLYQKAAAIKASGAQLICLLALSDEGKPFYDGNVAENFVNLDIPTFACTPDRFPELMAAAIKGERLPQDG